MRRICSMYVKRCPTCKAQRWHPCVSAQGHPLRTVHIARTRPSKEPTPDLRKWWDSMAPYEGKYAKRRPAGLVVP